MLRVQNESLLLSFFMAILLIISACETGGSNRESIEGKDLIEGADGAPSEEDSLKDNDTTDHRMDSVEVSELRININETDNELPAYIFETKKVEFLPVITKKLNGSRGEC